MKKGLVNKKEVFTDEDIRANRKFPVGNTLWLILIVLVQIGLITLAICYRPKPQDLIHQYNVTVEPLENGTLDITYHLVWEALDPTEDLTWLEIGIANDYYSVYPDSLSANIVDYHQYSDGEYITLDLDLDRPYQAGEVVEFFFKINQRAMLCKNDQGYFYEFVPGWFNAIQVQQYTFRWIMEDGEDLVQQGSFDYGEYAKMTVQYGPDDFTDCPTVEYLPFDDEGAYDELAEDKTIAVVMCCLFSVLLIIVEVYIIDSYVSYNRGRGFLSEHGYYVHTYGRTNPHYVRACNKYNATHGGRRGGRGGGGCACACACACAGGGRAGCSQKDTYVTGSPKFAKNPEI